MSEKENLPVLGDTIVTTKTICSGDLFLDFPENIKAYLMWTEMLW